MRTKFAKGFTLVEILVVVIIMGILAAVAVPKLFGSVAKAKSSELTVASGVYMRLQDAAVMSHGTVGNWKTIGYDAPGTGEVSKYFKYNEGNLTESNTKIEDLGDGMVGWEASNFVSLGGCKTNSLWQISLSASEGHHVKYTHSVNSAACLALASSFNQGDIASVGNTGDNAYVPPNGKTQVIGQDLFKDVSMSRVNGKWHPTLGYILSDKKPNEYGWKILNNDDNTDEKWKGTYELEPNTEYELTISVPEGTWDMNAGQYLQTEVRVYTQEPDEKTLPAIMLGTRSESEMPAEDPHVKGDVREAYTKEDGTTGYKYPNGNGYNTGSGTAENGYTASSSMKTENGMVTTTIKITTGADGGHLAANLFAYGDGWTDKRNTAVDNAIKNATLVKTGDTDKEESSSK